MKTSRTTQKLLVQQARYAPGPIRALFTPDTKILHEFDRFIMAGQPKRKLTIGRLSTCDIELGDPAVSRLHCEIVRHPDGSCVVIDAESTNGVFVNDVKVERAALWPGMWLFVGHTELIAVGDEPVVPITARTDTSFLVNAHRVHGSADKAADVIHRSASTVLRAVRAVTERLTYRRRKTRP